MEDNLTSERQIICPNCGSKIDPEDAVYTNINLGEENPHLQVSAPTCGICGHQFKDPDLLCIPEALINPNIRVFGGVIVCVLEE